MQFCWASAFPVPSSTRPLLSKSKFATCSATRIGWLVVSCITPCPSRMDLVRWLAAARNAVGEEPWEYSSKKWCSTCQA